MTMKNLEKQWRSNLSSILDELKKEEYEKLLLLLDKVPERFKGKKRRGEMPQIIIKHYGLVKSIKVISKAMDEIPRNDRKIQDLIQPMLKKLQTLTQQDTKTRKPAGAGGGENVQSPGRPSKRKRQPSPQPKVDSGASMKAKRKKAEQKDSSLPGSSAALQKTSTPGPRTTIKDLKASGDLGQKVLTVKVVRKSNLCQNKTRTKFYFHLGVADETDAIKVVGFGSKQFEHIKEGNFYIIKDASLDRQEKVLKVTEKKMLSETGSLEVPRNVELKAEKLIFSPVYSIRDVQSFGDKTPVSVEGTVKEINQTKKDVQNFKLEDGTGSIKIKFWPEDTKHLDGMSNGDVVQINNLQTNHYEGRVSLNSTRTTKLSNISEEKWRDAMTKIFEKLDHEQYKRLVQFYDEEYIFRFPRITGKFKCDLPKKFIEKYGLKESIMLINAVMNALQRNDDGVQNLLSPFVDKLKRQEKQMYENSGWKNALAHIIEELPQQQYKKMLECLVKIPQSVKDNTPREEMAQTIIEHYGEKESIAEIKRIMDVIPRRDPTMQSLLRPFVEKRERRSGGTAGGENVQSPGRPLKRKYLPMPQPEATESEMPRKKSGYILTEPLQAPEASSAGIRFHL